MGSDANAFGYNVSNVATEGLCRLACGTVTNNLNGKWVGFTHGSGKSAFLSRTGPTGDNGVTFKLNYQVAHSFAGEGCQFYLQ